MAKYQTAVRIRLSRTAHCVKYSRVRLLKVIMELLTTVIKKYTVFLDVKPCSLVEIYRHFWKTFCFHRWGKLSNRLFGNFDKFYLATPCIIPKNIYFSEQIIFRSCKREIVSLAADNMLAKNLVIRHKSQYVMSHLFSVYLTIFSL
jgi:hypothetical protein